MTIQPSSIAPTFEDALAIIKGTTNPLELARRMPDIEAGLEDLKTRLQKLEAARAAELHDVQELKVTNAQQAAVIQTLGADRDDARKRLDTLENPAAASSLATRLDAIEAELKRLRAQIAPIPATDDSAKKPFFSGPAKPAPDNGANQEPPR